MPSARISCFVDTNILIYPRDARAPLKRAAANWWILALAAADALVISPQVVNEYCNVILRKYPQTASNDLEVAVARMREWCRAETTYANALGALELKRTMLVSYYGAVLLSSAAKHVPKQLYDFFDKNMLLCFGGASSYRSDGIVRSEHALARCSHFLSEDLQHDRLIGQMRVLNPFLVSPETVLAA